MATIISHSSLETQAWAQSLGQRAQTGLVIGLIGDLGSGKTQFAKGFARGLGVQEPILSPTFALLHSYVSGRLALYHIDFYRLDNQEQIVGAGLEEYFSPKGVTLVEWWDRWQGTPPLRLWRVEFETLNEADRRIVYDCPCP